MYGIIYRIYNKNIYNKKEDDDNCFMHDDGDYAPLTM
jgi:hypothetical protein